MKNWNISRKISVATALAVAISISLLVFMSTQQTKSEISRISKQNYTLISALLAKQASGAMRWKKVKLIQDVYQHIANAKDSTLANLTVFDVDGKVIVDYASKTLPIYDLTNILATVKGTEKQPGILETDSHLIMSVPAFAGKNTTPVGTFVIAWSMESTNQEISNSQFKNVIVGLVNFTVLILLLIYLIKAIVTKPLRQVINLTQDLAEGEGDLSKRINLDRNDELAELAKWINTFIEKVHHLVCQVKDTSGQLTSESATLASVVESGNVALENQKRDIDQVATAINEMAATVSEVARNAADASSSAQEASGAADSGQAVVTANINSISSLANEVDTTAIIITELANDTETIGGILDVIRGIAEQTNLLALNAAIEAARAGEQGRGFAVVADEVRTLASRTQVSTQEIQQMIERLQNGAKKAVSAMQQGKEKASDSVKHSSNVQESLTTITNLVMKISDMNAQIATAAEEQNQVTEEINRNVVNVHSLFEHSVDNAQQSATSGGSVASLANELQVMIGQFKV